MDRASKEKTPPTGGVLLTTLRSWAPRLLVLTTLLLAGAIALAHRIVLLLLSRFLTATLLLARLLTWALLAGVLTLLTRILVLLLRHSGNSLVGRQRRDNGRHPFWLPAEPGSSQLRNPKVK